MRALVSIVAVASLLAGPGLAPPARGAELSPPILFVHGNGDNAALWITTVWRFESNGYDPARLFAIDFTHPSARTDDTKPQENRSSADDALRELAAKVAEILARTGQKQVVLIGSSRGGNAIRNYVKFGGGAPNVSHAILGGSPNHGTQATNPNLNNEFHGAGSFLTRLNTPDEVVAGVRFMTIRSDSNDKYAQPEGRFVGMPGQPTGVTFAGPELRGATNAVLSGLDHREVAFHRLAFNTMFAFITGAEPKTLDPVPQVAPVLDGLVSGFAGGTPTNVPMLGATVEVYEVDPASGVRRGGEPAHRKTIGADGHWGPFRGRSDAYYEFVLTAEGYPTTHIYRTPFPRSSRYVHVRPRLPADKERGAGALVTLTRPRGYLGHGRDTFVLDGKVPAGVNEGVPGTSEATQRFEPGPSRGVPVGLNAESMTVRTYPLEQGHVTVAEFHY
ncbi:MAG TPA: alpha/beta fold hydrolase [Methylomirabilota bacterium]|nr:alpha/beta fold hydrolase [Methylomirabilota bacterium]